MTQTGQTLSADSIDPALLSLAMAFVPTQVFGEPYEPSLAFSRGTIFPALDKPFLGEEALPS
jgi:hypothetical protein